MIQEAVWRMEWGKCIDMTMFHLIPHLHPTYFLHKYAH